MSYGPAYSPWGLIQTRKTLCPGFFDVSTASHGGIMVAREFVAGNLSPAAQRYGFWEGGYFYAARRLEVRATVVQLTGRISKIAAAAKGLLQSYEETEG